MAFRNPPIAGNYLVRPAIQSPNYVAGTTGWTINRDGTSEFNFGTFRGAVITVDQSTLDSSELQGEALSFFNQTNPPGSRASIVGRSNSSGSELIFESGYGNSSNGSMLWLLDALMSPDGKSYVRVNQKTTHTNGGVTGSVVQTDTDNSSNNCLHVQAFTETADASGHSTFNHGCSFTPQYAFFVNGQGNSAAVTIWATSFTATQVTVNVFEAFTTPYTSNGFNCVGLFFA